MSYTVSSWFVDQAASKSPQAFRRFMIGYSDYSDHVEKWPKVSRRWDRPRPIDATIQLSNADGALNFLRLDKTLLRTRCKFQFGFAGVDNLLADANDFTGAAWTSINTPIVIADYDTAPDGSATADYIEDNSAADYEYVRQYETGIDTSQSFVGSYLVKKQAISGFCPAVRLVFGPSTIEVLALIFRLDSGAFQTQTTGGTLLYADVEDYNEDYWRVWVSGTTSDGSNTWAALDVIPAYANGSFTVAPSNTGYVIAAWARLDTGFFPRTYNEGAELLDSFVGRMKKLAYKRGKCQITLVDKMQSLGQILIGTKETPVDYTASDHLLSDLAWYVVTSHGGYSGIQSDTNPDINYEKFSEWAGVMSGDSVKAQGYFDGVKVTEALRKIARMSHSAVYIEEDKLVFSRFSSIESPRVTVDNASLIDGSLAIEDDDIINKQYVNAAFNVDSGSFAITVFDQDSASINSYGLHEHVEEDKNLWFADSTSALSLAQRILYTNGDPVDRIQAKTPLTTLTEQIGDVITYTQALQGISDNYRVMEHSVDFDNAELILSIDQTQVINPFILDVTSLDGSEVLT